MTLPGSTNLELSELRRLIAFGTGVGIEVHGRDLEIVVARVRPGSVDVLGRATVRGFRERPAADWGAEYHGFLKKLNCAYLSATVLLPRREVIARPLALPGVAVRDIPSAIGFQLDSLHPYDEDAVSWGWARLGAGTVLVGIARGAVIERYTEIFEEAGIAVAVFTFSASAIYSALRLFGGPRPGGILALVRRDGESSEFYGESEARPVLSAEFDLPPERAAAVASSELRLDGAAGVSLAAVLPVPRSNPAENDLERNPLPYVAALAGACPRLAAPANLLPPERRKASSRLFLVPTAVLVALLLLAAGAAAAYSSFEDRRYLRRLEAEIRRLEPQKQRADALDREIGQERQRAHLLDDFRDRTRYDLETLNELTRLLPPPIWTNNVEMTPDNISVIGESDQAAGLIKVLDNSPFFRNSEFTALSRVGGAEMFRIRTVREGRK